MKTAEPIGTPISSEWTMEVSASEACELARLRLEARGYRLNGPAEENEDGCCRVVMDHERTLGARQRRSGKLMLAVAVALTLVLLVMMARDIGSDRVIVSGPLLVAVLLGGLGMNRLRTPLRSERRTMNVSVTVMPDGCGVLVKGATASGPVAITDEPPTAAEVAAAEQALLEDMRVVEGRSGSTEGAP